MSEEKRSVLDENFMEDLLTRAHEHHEEWKRRHPILWRIRSWFKRVTR